MTSAQVVETSVTTTDNSPSQDYTHPDDQTALLHERFLLHYVLRLAPRAMLRRMVQTSMASN